MNFDFRPLCPAWYAGGLDDYRVQALVELTCEFAEAFFHGAVAGRVAGWAVERQHPLALQDLVHGFLVEGTAVAPFSRREEVP